ncbi:hypothetical protein RB620_22945 [Paenibacillus sp. LHD-117]|uniref:hypothetical protein n=1 Tax=Paenibacillus sp. LHD-117 TaxID=3071412 RepID=UPI0027E178FD|nr:hypothetical protein [Paenibacillus sp. LHD-117]MDQ6422290.1 hypothetical protein [Paenibacillus sp. LHD-117]
MSTTLALGAGFNEISLQESMDVTGGSWGGFVAAVLGAAGTGAWLGSRGGLYGAIGGAVVGGIIGGVVYAAEN